MIVAAGRFSLQKDFENLIRAFAIVVAQRPCRLLLLGEGDERPSLEALVAELGIESAVSMPGFCDNPYAILSRSAMFVLSSRWEGLPTVLIEALACGVPVVSTDCPSGPDEILQGGKYGRLVPIQDHERLALAMIETLESPIYPPLESWQPYEASEVIRTYEKTLLGKSVDTGSANSD